MPATPKITDDTIRRHLNDGFNQTQIASLCCVSPAAISKRLKRLDRRRVAKVPTVVSRAHASIFDIKTALEENYQRLTALLAANDFYSVSEKVRAIGEVRQHIALSVQVLETLYSLTETQEFMGEVLAVLEECQPGTRDAILGKLADKRALRSAFVVTGG